MKGEHESPPSSDNCDCKPDDSSQSEQGEESANQQSETADQSKQSSESEDGKEDSCAENTEDNAEET